MKYIFHKSCFLCYSLYCIFLLLSKGFDLKVFALLIFCQFAHLIVEWFYDWSILHREQLNIKEEILYKESNDLIKKMFNIGDY